PLGLSLRRGRGLGPRASPTRCATGGSHAGDGSAVCRSTDLVWHPDGRGVSVGSERMHTVTNHVAERLTVLEVAPARDEIARRITAVAADRWRRPVVVLGIDGAFVPTRPDSTRARRPGRRGQRDRRAGWRGQWRDAKGFRFYLLDG